MEFKKIAVGELAANAYILYRPERDDAVLIDPGGEPEGIRRALGSRRPAAILLTHGHWDHIGAVAALREGGVPVYIHPKDAPMLTDPVRSLALGKDTPQTQGVPDMLLEEGPLALAGIGLEVLHTPGHTPGGVCFLSEGHLFSGDTLFAQGYGRTDLPGGSMPALAASLRRLLSLDGAIRVHPGHGDATAIGPERRYLL